MTEQQMEQVRLQQEQEMERHAAEQKARDEAFACRRCATRFPINSKLMNKLQIIIRSRLSPQQDQHLTSRLDLLQLS